MYSDFFFGKIQLYFWKQELIGHMHGQIICPYYRFIKNATYFVSRCNFTYFPKRDAHLFRQQMSISFLRRQVLIICTDKLSQASQLAGSCQPSREKEWKLNQIGEKIKGNQFPPALVPRSSSGMCARARILIFKNSRWSGRRRSKTFEHRPRRWANNDTVASIETRPTVFADQIKTYGVIP